MFLGGVSVCGEGSGFDRRALLFIASSSPPAGVGASGTLIPSKSESLEGVDSIEAARHAPRESLPHGGGETDDSWSVKTWENKQTAQRVSV